MTTDSRGYPLSELGEIRAVIDYQSRKTGERRSRNLLGNKLGEGKGAITSCLWEEDQPDNKEERLAGNSNGSGRVGRGLLDPSHPNHHKVTRGQQGAREKLDVLQVGAREKHRWETETGGAFIVSVQ